MMGGAGGMGGFNPFMMGGLGGLVGAGARVQAELRPPRERFSTQLQ
jgi:hypothetical protein